MDIEKIINILAILLEDHTTLLYYSHEIKSALSMNYEENILGKKMKERGLLIDKIASSIKYYHSIKTYYNFADTNNCKTQINKLIHRIQKLLDSTVLLDKEIISLIRQRVEDITLNIEKNQEGKHFVNTLKKELCDTPSFVDICG